MNPENTGPTVAPGPLRLLHLVDDEKFIAFIADVFARVPGVTNEFVIFVDDPSRPRRYTAGFSDARIQARGATVSKTEIDADAVIVHYLDMAKVRFLRCLPRKLPVVWSGWGADYYQVFGALQHGLLGDATRSLWDALREERRGPARWAAGARRWAAERVNEARMRRFVREVDFFSAPVPGDYDVIRPLLSARTRYVQLNYASVEQTFDIGEPRAIADQAADILVGNSASATNNHLEMFDLIAAAGLPEGVRVVVPLSYGHARYRDAVVEAGRRRLGECFVPLIEFMPLERYNSIVAACGSVVMGHRRQQAVGNIVTMMYKGARVFVDGRTTTHAFLRQRGAVIHDLEELARQPELLARPLSAEERRRNVEIIDDFWSERRVHENAATVAGLLRDRISPDLKTS